MKMIGNKRAIGWAVNAAMRSPGVDVVVVATSTNKENDVLEDWCNKQGVSCFRGSEDDVLDRYCQLINKFEPTNIIRLTGDCPLLDSNVIGETIALQEATGSVYCTNQWPPVWPDGLDVEVIRSQALIEAGKEATDQIDRDTVTQFVWRNQSRWPAASLSCPLPGLEKERWVLDSPEDYELLQMIVKSFPEDWVPNYLDIWRLLNKNPALREVNQQWYRNQRFFEALGEQPLADKSFVRSGQHLRAAKRIIPNASQTFSKSCKSFPAQGPLFATHGSGSYIFDVDGNRYVDLVGSLLPNILGYCDPDVDFAIRRQLDKGICLSLATELELELAELLNRLIPCAEAVRFGKNGSDATSGAVRLARAKTGNAHIGIIEGGDAYHGWHDWAVAHTVRSAGVPDGIAKYTHRLKPDISAIKNELGDGGIYAAIVIDPENHDRKFLSQLRDCCTNSKTILIFDEIRTGFRYSLGGYQQYAGVIPDLACFGKSIANGMPISAIVGRRNIMDEFNNDAFWSGTFFGETLSIAAALATIKKMQDYCVLGHLFIMGKTIMNEVKGMIGTLDGLAITGQPQRPILSFYDDDYRLKFMKGMAEEGVLIINSCNTCYAMGDNELDRVLTAFKKVLG